MPAPKISWKLTAGLLAAEIGFTVADIRYLDALYLASVSTLLETIMSEGGKSNNILVIGHNPGLTELINRISNIKLDNLPTCGIVSLVAEINGWQELPDALCACDWHFWPKRDFD